MNSEINLEEVRNGIAKAKKSYKYLLIWSLAVFGLLAYLYWLGSQGDKLDQMDSNQALIIMAALCVCGIAIYWATCSTASRLGRSGIVWFGIVFIFSIFGLIAALIVFNNDIQKIQQKLERE